jgi:hypothetical protein
MLAHSAWGMGQSVLIRMERIEDSLQQAAVPPLAGFPVRNLINRSFARYCGSILSAPRLIMFGDVKKPN